MWLTVKFIKYIFYYNTGCSKSLGHILIMNISETIKDIKHIL